MNIKLHSNQGSIITISGLTVSATPSTTNLTVAYPAANPQQVFGSTAKWTQSSGTLRLEISSAGAAALEAGQLYSFSFQLRNPSIGQQGASVTISGSG